MNKYHAEAVEIVNLIDNRSDRLGEDARMAAERQDYHGLAYIVNIASGKSGSNPVKLGLLYEIAEILCRVVDDSEEFLNVCALGIVLGQEGEARRLHQFLLQHIEQDYTGRASASDFVSGASKIYAYCQSVVKFPMGSPGRERAASRTEDFDCLVLAFPEHTPPNELLRRGGLL